MEGQTTHRMKTRADVDEFDDKFEGEEQVPWPADVSSEDDDDETTQVEAADDLNTNKVGRAAELPVL